MYKRRDILEKMGNVAVIIVVVIIGAFLWFIFFIMGIAATYDPQFAAAFATIVIIVLAIVEFAPIIIRGMIKGCKT